jgi:hypothetical protein
VAVPPPSSRIWAPLGAALVVGVIVWRLAGATYRSDVETICRAEDRSGFTLRRDMPALADWVRGHLATSEGNELYASLGDVSMARRADRLRQVATTLGLTSCTMVSSYEELVVDGRYRAELQRLCSYLTFPDLERLDDASRLDVIEAWIDGEATDPRTKALGEPLRAATTPAERARLLRAAAREIDVFSCDLAKTIVRPPVAAADAGTTDGASE